MATFSGILSSISTLLLMTIGVWGFVRWKKELFAKRRIDLCEDVLARLYESRDAIDAIRSSAIFAGEGSSRSPTDGESEEVRRQAASAYIYTERFEKRKEPLIELNKLRYKFAAAYGSPWLETFQVFAGTVNKIIVTGGLLARADQETPTFRSEEEIVARVKRLDGMRAILWKDFSLPEPDPIDAELQIAHQRLEEQCRNEIRKASAIWFGFLEK